MYYNIIETLYCHLLRTTNSKKATLECIRNNWAKNTSAHVMQKFSYITVSKNNLLRTKHEITILII